MHSSARHVVVKGQSVNEIGQNLGFPMLFYEIIISSRFKETMKFLQFDMNNTIWLLKIDFFALALPVEDWFV